MKRILILTVSVILVLTTAITPIFAEDVSSQSSVDENEFQLSEIDNQLFEEDEFEEDVLGNTFEHLENLGVSVEASEVSEDDTLLLDAQVGSVDATIEVLEANSEEIAMQVTEGEKTNVIEYRDDDSIWIDGSELQITETQFIVDDDVVIPNSKHIYKTTKTCPYGSASDYTHKGAVIVRNLEREKQLRTYTLIAWGAMLSALTINAGATVSLPIIGITTGASIQSAMGTSKIVSIEVTKYMHKTKGVNITSHKKVWKETCKYSPNKNISGTTAYTGSGFVTVEWS
jgi:hypothetical protein